MKWAVIKFAAVLLALQVANTALAVDECDLALGKKIFIKCAACHSYNASGTHGAGPNLYALLDRTAGTAGGFPYSQAMQNYAKRWTTAELDNFLQQPMAAIPGTTMAFAGLAKPHQRRAVICFLTQGGD